MPPRAPPHGAPSSYSTAPAMSGGRRDASLENRKLYIGGLPTTGIDEQIIRHEFSKFGELEDCFVPADRNDPSRIRGIAFVTYPDECARAS